MRGSAMDRFNIRLINSNRLDNAESMAPLVISRAMQNFEIFELKDHVNSHF